jgi:hypothetical protein
MHTSTFSCLPTRSTRRRPNACAIALASPWRGRRA